MGPGLVNSKIRKERSEVCRLLLEKIWGIQNQSLLSDPQLDAYLNHYANLAAVIVAQHGVFNDPKDIIELVELLKSWRAESIPKILKNIKFLGTKWSRHGFDDAQSSAALDFAIKLWLFTECDLRDDSLVGAVQRVHQNLYDKCGISNTASIKALSTDFCAKSLTRKAGFYLVFTSDLAEHLTFASRDQLRVFRHAHILDRFQTDIENDLFPEDFLYETHRTLHLLFPFEDLKTSKRVRSISRKKLVDIEVSLEKGVDEYEKFQLDSYHYYGSRLAEIQKRYDAARPRRLKQWWFDRRQRVEWGGLMLALILFILTVIFGGIQSVTGILQVIRS